MSNTLKLKPSQHPALQMIGASASFAIMAAFVKTLHRLPAWEVTFFRALTNFAILLPWALRHPKAVATWRNEPIPLLIRGVSGGLSILFYFYAIEHMKLADAVMLNQAAPILVLVISAFVLGERLTPLSAGCVLVAFAGIGLILKPGFQLRSHEEALGGLAGLGSACVAAIAYVAIKVATRSIPPKLIVFTFAFVATLISAIPTIMWFEMPVGWEWARLFAAGAFATFAQEMMTRGYAGLPASVASPILLLIVPISTCFGWFQWGELPDGWSAVGMALLIGGLLGAYRFKRAL